MHDPENPRVQKRVATVLAGWGKHHDVGMCAHVDRVLVAPDIVRGVVDAQDSVVEKAIVQDNQPRKVRSLERSLAVVGVQYARKKVVPQSRKKGLRDGSLSENA
jgi:hypothetical protein